MKLFEFVVAIVSVIMFFSSSCLEAASIEEPAASSSGDLMIAPQRIVFEGTVRTAEVSLMNRSDRPLTYGISFVQYRMTENGMMKEITEAGPNELFASPYIRFTPRRVLLEPHQMQTVLLQLLKPQGLKDGEYRSHLLLCVLPTAKEEKEPDVGNEGKSLSIKMVTIYGVSIPVIVRHGALSVTTGLSGLSLAPKKGLSQRSLSVTIERDGNCSTFGDLVAEWKASGNNVVSIGRVNGIAVYTSIAKRRVSLPLSLPAGLEFHGGQLTVRFIDHVNEKILAEATLLLP